MAPYHSRFNDAPSGTYKECCGCPLLPLNAAANASSGQDIVDEAIELYRPNSLFRAFEIKGGGDKLLAYLTLYISACLKRLSDSRATAKDDALKLLRVMAAERFALPGQAGFALGGLMTPPAGKEEEDAIRSYLQKLRDEVGRRLVERVWSEPGPDGSPGAAPNKLWMGFAHRRFLDRTIS